MTLQVWDTNEYLLRVSHQFGVNEDSRFAVPVTVDIANLFSGFKITKLREVSLTGNRDIEEMKQMKWNMNDMKTNFDKFEFVPLENGSIVLNPMDIRTFIFSIL